MSFRRMADALIVYGCSRSMNCATFAQLSSTHEICKAAGTYPQTAADHRADSVNLITTSTHPHDVSIERINLNMIGLAERRHHERRLKEKRKNDAHVSAPAKCSCWMCGNPRRFEGNSKDAKTIKELSDLESVEVWNEG